MTRPLTERELERRELERHQAAIAAARRDLATHGKAYMARRVRSQQAARMRRLADPQWRLLRLFPAWHAGMSTAEYVRTYERLQNLRVTETVAP